MQVMRNQSIADVRDERDVFQALADPTRRAILTLLQQGSQPVNGIARDFPISRPADLEAPAHLARGRAGLPRSRSDATDSTSSMPVRSRTSTTGSRTTATYGSTSFAI